MDENKGSLENNQLDNNTNQGEQSTEKTYTQAEVQALLQQEADRRVSSALKKQQKEFETKLAEAEKLKSMDETQRKEYEYNQRLQQLEQKEHEFAVAQNKLEATKILASRDLPIEFVDYIVADDAETMLENINTFDTLFKASVADAVSKRIASPSPKQGQTQQKGMTKDDFRKLSIVERTRLQQTNPTLYNSLKT